MLNDSSYHMAIFIYVGSALVFIVYLGWWLGRHWRAGWVTLVVLLMAALLLTPAYPKAGVHTMAPALIVAAFQFMTAGLPSAVYALRPLVFLSGGAVIVALLLSMTVLRRRKVLTTSERWARVMPTYIKRRSSSRRSAVISSSPLRKGSKPSFTPANTTCVHSRPLAACRVERVTKS